MRSVKTEKLKFQLDKFLELISDQPKLPNYVTTARINIIIIDRLSHRRAPGIYDGDEVSDSQRNH